MTRWAPEQMERKAAEIRERLERNRQEARERAGRIANCEVELDDCFVSVWANDLTTRLDEMRLRILERGGTGEFLELECLDGEPITAVTRQTRFGHAYLVMRQDGSEEWVSCGLKPKTLERKGYREVWVEHPAWARIEGTHAVNCGVHMYRLDEPGATLEE